MLPLTFASYFVAGCQLISQHLRRSRYERVLHSVLPWTSVVIHRLRTVCEAVHQLENVKEEESSVQFKDDYIQICDMRTLKEINLSAWTSYNANLVGEDEGLPCCENLFVLVETQYLVDQVVKRKQPEARIHVFTLGKPVAWKSTDHFEVIICCELPALTQMVDAYGQDRLILDEDLQIKGFATVKLCGQPQCHYTNGRKGLHSKSSTSNSNGGGDDDNSGLTANNDNTQFSSAISFSNTKPMSSQFTSSSSHKQPMDSGSNDRLKSIKPPNVLVYCGEGNESDETFVLVKASLEMCINTDVYIIYHLTHDTVLTAPWVDNAALLLVCSSSELQPEVEQRIKDFVFLSKGTLLSFNSSVESAFAEKITGTRLNTEQLFTFSFEDSTDIKCLRGQSSYQSKRCSMETIISADSNTGADDGRDLGESLVVKIKCKDAGTVVLSQLYLEKDPALTVKDPALFAALKGSNSGRLAVLKHILALLGLDTSPRANPKLTPSYLLTQNQEAKRKFLRAVHRKLDKDCVLPSQNMGLAFLEKADPSGPVESNLLPVITGTDYHDDHWKKGFDETDYWNNLQTSRLGQVVLYTEVITSTMHVFDGMLFDLPRGLSPVAIAGRQISGRGRGGNMWLSPLGCAMFTFPISFDLSSVMGQRISFLQHLVSASVVHSIRSMPGYEALDLRLKWPNDIYYGKEMKLGGVIVTSTLMGSTLYATIGCGVNVANSDPTICINNIIQHHNRSQQDKSLSLPLLTPAGVIAKTLSTLEGFITDFERYGHLPFCEIYYKYWLHGDKQVTLSLDGEDGHFEGKIIGLDEYGFLAVSKPSGEIISVQPDGNSFDMMQNLVYSKRK